MWTKRRFGGNTLGGRRYFTTTFCDNGIVAKTGHRNLGDLVFFESRMGIATIIRKELCQFRLSQREK